MEGPTSGRSPQGGSAFHSLRDYEPGDDTRLIDWKATARTGSLTVRHNVVPDEPRHLIVLDTSAQVYSGTSFEDAVRVAASLCAAAGRAGFPVDLRLTDAPDRADSELGALDLLSGVDCVASGAGLSGLVGVVEDVLMLSDATALSVVTGRPAPEHLDLLATLRPRFLTIGFVQICEPPSVAPAGVISVSAPTSERFAAAWNHLAPQ